MTSTASGWSQVAIADIANFASGELISVASLSEESGLASIPVFGGNGIVGYTQAATVVEPTVILGRVGQKCGVVYTNSGPAWVTDNALFARSFKRRMDTSFFAYALEHARLNDLKNRNDLPLITQSILRDVLIAIPESIDEQERIAGAIRRADDLISSLIAAIAKRRAIKQGMMQELLTGQVRLPGFRGQWKSIPVSELLEFKNGLNKASQYFGHGTPIVNFMDVMRSPVITADRVKGLVSLSRDEIGRFSARRGDMFFTRTSESVEEVGTAAVLVDDITDAVFSGFVLRGRPMSRMINTTFLAFQFQLASIRSQVAATASYTTRALTNGGSLGRIKMLVPNPNEQTEIVEVIRDVDSEIEAIERRLESARTIKTGMMQELLTGRTRLPVEAVS